MLSLKQLRYALAVEDTLHFYRAAERCAVSQSTLSAAISNLEQQLGVQLFERDTKKVLVTTAGREILARARPLLLQSIDLEQFARSFSQELPQQLRAGVIPTVAPYLLPRVLPALRREFADFRFYIKEGQTQALLQQLRNGELDVAIIALPFDIDGLLAFEFWQESFLWLGRDSDANGRQHIAVDSLRPGELLLLEEGHCFKDHVLSLCGSRAVLQGQFAGSSLQTVVQMVAGGIGQTLIPALAREQLLQACPELVSLPLDVHGPHRQLAFVVRPAFSEVAMVERLCALFRSTLNHA